MGVLDGFFSTWSNAKATFGEGTPQGGAQFDGSGTLNQLKSNLDSAAPGSKWTGTAATAYGTANTEHQRVIGELGGLDKRLAAHVDESARIVSAGRSQLDAVRSWVVDAAGSVPNTAEGQRMLIPIANKGIGQVAKIVQKTNGDLNTVGGKIRDVGKEYDALGNQKFAPKDGPEFAAGEDDKKTPSEDGKGDGKSLEDGKLSPEERKRLLDAGKLTQQQLDDLAHGKQVNVGADRMAYLYQLSQSMNGMTPQQIKDMQANLPANERAALAQGLAIVSNKNAVSGVPNTGGVTDATRDTFVPAAGSLVNLPDGMYHELSRTDRVTTEFPGGVAGRNQPPTTHLNGVGALQDTAEIFKPAGAGYLNGSEATKQMLDASAQYAKVDADHRSLTDFNNLESDAHGPLKNGLADVISVAGNDHVGVHDLATGSGGDDFLKALTHEEWGDQSSKVGTAFNWMDDDPNNGINSETANKVGHYIADKAPELKNLPWSNDTSFAAANPGLASAMAEGISPYLTEFAGGGPAMGIAHQGVDAFANGRQMQDVFSVFDRSPESAIALNQAARDQYQDIMARASSGDGRPNGNELEVGGRLLNAMSDGADDAGKVSQGEDLDTFKKVIGMSKLPFFGEASDLADIWKQVQAHDLPPIYTQAEAQAGTGTVAFQTDMLNGMLTTHPELANDPVLQSYMHDGHIVITDDAKTKAGSALSDWFRDVAPRYGVDENEWADERDRGNNDDW